MKMTKEQAELVVSAASTVMVETPGYRWGQALFNELPKEVADSIRGTSGDMYYVTDDSKATIMFNDLVE